MRSFFRSLEAHRVSHILISGQAAVIYGAATFSEDVDLWVEPTVGNLGRLSTALRAAGARVYRLTPPLEPRYAKAGHGFHFVLPDDPVGPRFLDLMGRPPRVGSFRVALKRARTLPTAWGKVPVVAVRELVELKKTRCLGDYDTISKLVRVELSAARPTATVLRWALKNVFRFEEAEWILRSFAGAWRLAAVSRRRSVAQLARAWPGQKGGFSPEVEARVRAALNAEIAALQQRDVAYWSPVIQELRALRRSGGLLRAGTLP